MEDVSDLLGAVVGDFDTDMRLICREGLTEAFLLTLREPITRGAQEKPDLVEGIALAPAVTGRVLLDAATYLIESVTCELDDVKGVEDAGGVLELVINGVFISLEGIQCRDSHPRTEVFAALGQPVLVHGARPSWDQIQQAGRGVILPACQVHDAGELTGPRRRRSWWCHTCSSTPNTCTPAKRAGSSHAACRHGLIWDHTVFHVVPNWRASPEIVAPSKRNCRIAQRIARAPRRALGAHTEWFCSVKVAIWQVCSRHIHRRLCHRIRAGTPAQGASITSTTTRP